MQRQFDPATPELMDRPQPVTPELERDLHNLRELNRYLGGHRIIRHFLRNWLQPHSSVKIVDLATASGDVPRLAVDFARSTGARVQIDAIDQQASSIEIARELSANYPEIAYHVTDIFAWGPPRSYDIVLCSLALHHFSDDDAVRVLRHTRELSRAYVLVADLRRGWLATLGVHLLTSVIYREPMTRVDARVSAARAFSFAEMRNLAKRAGWQNFEHARFRFARQAIWMENVN